MFDVLSNILKLIVLTEIFYCCGSAMTNGGSQIMDPPFRVAARVNMKFLQICGLLVYYFLVEGIFKFFESRREPPLDACVLYN